MRLFRLQVGEQGSGRPRERHAAGAAIGRRGHTGRHPVGDDAGRPRVRPEDRGPHLPPVGVEEPESVALRREAEQIGGLTGADLANHLADRGNDLFQILLGAAGGRHDGSRRSRGDAQHLAVIREGDGLDDRRSRVDADQHRPVLYSPAMASGLATKRSGSPRR